MWVRILLVRDPTHLSRVVEALARKTELTVRKIQDVQDNEGNVEVPIAYPSGSCGVASVLPTGASELVQEVARRAPVGSPRDEEQLHA